jgi:hypothetical protein
MARSADDKHDPSYYARHMVIKAQAELANRTIVQPIAQTETLEQTGLGNTARETAETA